MSTVAVLTPKLTQYRLPLFNELAKHLSLSVVEFADEPDRPWEVPIGQADDDHPFVHLALSTTSGRHGAREIWGLLDRQDPDWLLVPGWATPPSWVGLAWAKRRSRKAAVVFESWRPQRAGAASLATGIGRRGFLGAADLALAVGVRAADYAAYLGFDAEVVHWNVADVDAAGAAATKARRKPGKLRLLYAGRYVKIKNIDLLVEFARRNEDDIDVRFMGAGRALGAAAPPGFTPQDLGSVRGEDRFIEMANADALVLVSEYEPWGVVVHEALATGTPVLASRSVGSAPELVHEGVTGAVVRANLRGLANGVDRIRALLEGASTADDCQRVARTITYESVAEELLRALEIST